MLVAAAATDDVCLLIQVETRKGPDNLDALLALAGKFKPGSAEG